MDQNLEGEELPFLHLAIRAVLGVGLRGRPRQGEGRRRLLPLIEDGKIVAQTIHYTVEQKE